MRWLRTAVGVVAVIAVIGVLGYTYLQKGDPPTALEADGTRVQTGRVDTPGDAPREGSIAPGFVLAGYDGQAVRLSDYRGKTVLLNFWASWCTTCAEEMPYMQRLASEHPDDFVVLAVNQAEGTSTARAWSDGRSLGALVFALDHDKSVSSAYKLSSGLPHSFFIDKDGYVRAVIQGGMSYDDMRQRLEKAQSPRPAG
jgi:thiol-disulfide isomerase/thioredoxin